MSSIDARPEAVTRACLVAGTGTVLTLITVFSLLSDWGGIETREQVEAALESSPITGVGADQILEVARIVLIAIALFAVAGLVLSIYTAKRDRSARIGLTVLSAGWLPVALVFGLLGVLLSLMGAMTLALLWRPESRRWFAVGDAQDPPSLPRQESPSVSMPPPPPPPGHGGYPAYGSDQPMGGAVQPGAAPPAGPPPYGPPPYGPTPYAPAAYGRSAGVIPERRPAGVTTAAIITLVASGLAALGCGALGLTFLLAPASFEDGVDSALGEGMSARDVSVIASVYGWYFVACTVLALIAVVLAVLLLRDRHRVRVPLVVISAITVVLALGGFPLGLLWSAAAVSVIVLLFVGNAGAWFDLRNHRSDRERASY